MKKIIYILLLIKSFDINGQELFFGKGRHGFVYANIKDSIAFIEFCQQDFKGHYYMRIDTLKYNNGKYANHDYRLEIQSESYKFYPGKIELKKCNVVDTNLYSIRIWAYSEYKWRKFIDNYKWGDTEWKKMRIMKPENISTIPELAYKDIDNSIHEFEVQFIRAFNQRIRTIIITDDEVFSKKEYLNTNDSVMISHIWQQLMDTQIEKGSNFYQYQSLSIWLCWGIIDPFAFLYGSIPSYIISLGLYKAEIFIADRFVSKKTFDILIYSENSKVLKIKLRRDYIVNDMSKFKLRNEFKIN